MKPKTRNLKGARFNYIHLANSVSSLYQMSTLIRNPAPCGRELFEEEKYLWARTNPTVKMAGVFIYENLRVIVAHSTQSPSHMITISLPLLHVIR